VVDYINRWGLGRILEPGPQVQAFPGPCQTIRPPSLAGPWAWGGFLVCLCFHGHGDRRGGWVWVCGVG